MTIADAPWIREAEMYGPDDPEPVFCPCCGEECSEIFADQYGNVFACEHCLTSMDADEWAAEEKEKERD